jgi:hypothetical protein
LSCSSHIKRETKCVRHITAPSDRLIGAR